MTEAGETSGNSGLAAEHHAALARLGQIALTGIDIVKLLEEASAIVARALGVEFCKILELIPERQALLFRAGVGWKIGAGEVFVPFTDDSHCGHTLRSGRAVVIEDLRAEGRFPHSTLLHDHGVVSGASVIIPGAEPFGVLAVHTRRRRRFHQRELAFLKAAADVLAHAIHRHRTHQSVQQSEEQFRRTFEDSPIGMALYGLDHRFIRVNRVLCSMLHYSEEELLGLTFEQITHPADVPKVGDLATRLLSGEIPHFHLEQRCRTKGGAILWTSLTATIISDEKGQPLHAVSMIEDLTARRREERDLRLARFTLDHAQEAIGWAGPNGRILDVNQSLCRLLGYSRRELLAMAVPDIDETTPAEKWREGWEDLRKRGSITRESRLRAKDGNIIPVEIAVSHLCFNGSEYACTIARDVSERKRIEETLRAGEERYRNLFENSAAMVWTIDLDGNITSINQTAERFSGFTRAELSGMNIAGLLPPDQLEVARSMIGRKLQDGVTTTYELDILTKGGHRRPMQITSRLIYENGKPVGVQGIGIDISEQRRVEEALRRSEEYHRALLEQALELVTILDADGTVRYVNPSVERVLGYRAEERIGRSTFELIHPGDLSGVQQVLARGIAQPGAAATLDFRIRQKDGSWRYLEATARNLLDNPAVGAIVVNSRDVTQRKLAEEALQESQEWFRSSFQDSGIGAAITTLDGRYLRVNPALCRFLGYSEQELLRLQWKDVTHPDDLNASGQDRARLLAGDLSCFEVEKRYIRKDGHVAWGHLMASLIRDAEGRPRYHTVQITDITLRKAAEEALHRSQDELRALAARLLGREEEEHRLLARELHDDFSQRLTAAGFELAELEKAWPAGSPAGLKKTLRRVQSRIAGVSDDMRRLAHQLHPATVELLGLPAALRALCQEASKQGKFVARFSSRTPPPSVPRDSALCVYRVAQESLRNIAKHARASKGSVTLTGAARAVRLTIKDNGIGFGPDSLGRMPGLGLVSMRERVRLAGGSFQVHSTPGKGTEVVLDLPLLPPGPQGHRARRN